VAVALIRKGLPFIALGCIQPACGEPEPVSFPPGLEPLEDMFVDAPAATGGEPYPEEVSWASGDEGDYGWIQARGYIHATPSEAWESLRSEAVFIDHRKITEYELEELDSDVYDYVFLVHNTVEDILTVEFDVEWRHGSSPGGSGDPDSVAVRWQKTVGTDFISMLQGSILFFPPEEGADVVEVQIIEHLTATLEQEDNAVQYVLDLYGRWRADVNGDAPPSY
jgi:hypothetical protein